MWIWSAFIFIQLIAINYVVLSLHETETNSREKRHVVYPFGGTFKIVIAIAIPVKLGSKQSMACGWNLQFQYAEATNITQLQVYPPIIAKSRERRSNYISDRRLAYLTIENMIDRHNFNGESCLLRSICENALHPLNHPANGLYGHLLHIFLTPNYGNDIEHDLDKKYIESFNVGTLGLDCYKLYPDCQMENGILNLVSLLDY